MAKSFVKESLALLLLTFLTVGCGAGNGAGTGAVTPEIAAAAPSPGQGTTSEFKAEVWADNWFALYVKRELVGEDSTPITTERFLQRRNHHLYCHLPLDHRH